MSRCETDMRFIVSTRGSSLPAGRDITQQTLLKPLCLRGLVQTSRLQSDVTTELELALLQQPNGPSLGGNCRNQLFQKLPKEKFRRQST